MKKFLAGAALLLLLAVIVFFALRSTIPEPEHRLPPPPSRPTAETATASITATPAPKEPEPPLEQLDMAKELNAPNKTIQDDLHTIESVLLAWQSNFLKEGNPVGENVEITAALTGKNSLHLAFINPRHPAINANGELCDRWGTPFFFHQLSGTKMEIRSAGPDRKRGTADDAVLLQ